MLHVRSGWGRAALGIGISVVSLFACAWWVAHQEAPTIPTEPAALGELVAAVAVYLLLTALRGWRWHVVLRHAHIAHDRADAYGLTTVGYMGNAVLPARGGEVLRILLLAQRTSARRREVIGSVLTERILDAALLAVLFALLALIGAADTPGGPALAIVAAVLVAGGFLALVVYVRLRIAGHFEAFAARIRPVARASRLLLDRTGAALALVTAFVWALEALVLWLVAHALHVDVGPVGAMFVVVVASFFAMIPAGPGYVGTFDAAVLFGLSALDVSGGQAFSLLLLYRAVIFVPVALVGLGLVLVRYGGLGVLRRPLEEEPVIDPASEDEPARVPALSGQAADRERPLPAEADLPRAR